MGQLLYLDGLPLGSLPGQDQSMTFCEIGDGFSDAWPKGDGSWMRFKGLIARVKVARRGFRPDEIRAEYQTGLSSVSK